MTNSQTLGTIEATNPVLAVAPLKEETEMLRATDKITALYCRLSVEDLKEDKKGGKEDESNSIQNQKMILLQYAKEHRFPNPTFFVDDGYSGTNFDRPGFQAMLAEIEAGRVAVCLTKDLSRLGRNSSLTGLYINFTFPKYNVRYTESKTRKHFLRAHNSTRSSTSFCGKTNPCGFPGEARKMS